MTDTIITEMDIAEVCDVLGVSRSTVIRVTEEGIVDPLGNDPDQWLFDTLMVDLVKKACRIHQDLGVDWSGVALAIQLMSELEELRTQNQRLRQRIDRFIND